MDSLTPRGKDLVLTEAERVPPPDVTVPEPPHDPHLLREVQRLADQAGGLHALRDLVDRLIRQQSPQR